MAADDGRASASRLPGFVWSTIANGPPPPCIATAKNLVFPLMYCCSPVAVLSRKPVNWCSCFGGST